MTTSAQPLRMLKLRPTSWKNLATLAQFPSPWSVSSDGNCRYSLPQNGDGRWTGDVEMLSVLGYTMSTTVAGLIVGILALGYNILGAESVQDGQTQPLPRPRQRTRIIMALRLKVSPNFNGNGGRRVPVADLLRQHRQPQRAGSAAGVSSKVVEKQTVAVPSTVYIVGMRRSWRYGIPLLQRLSGAEDKVVVLRVEQGVPIEYAVKVMDIAYKTN